MIFSDGVLQQALEDTGAVDRARQEAVYRGIPSDLRAPSALRKVSLNRLEAAIEANGGVISDEMANLAGLTRIKNVFYYPETQDIVIAGPAEGWVPGIEYSTVGYKSLRPTLKLSDLAVALRAFPAGGQPTGLIGCSIDPTEEGLVAMRDYIQTQARPNVNNPAELGQYADGIRSSLGTQDVKVWGVSSKTGFAATLIAADYRMKLIGIGLEPAPVKMTTYVEKSNPQNASQNALTRWYFQPDYDCVIETKDKLGIGLLGDSVKLVGEDELVSEEGQRQVRAQQSNRASKIYTKSFTDQFDAIAQKVPVYASLRNLIDMSVAAAWLQREGIYEKAKWSADFLRDEARYPLETGVAIEKAATAVNIISHGQSVVSFPVGGGVMIEPVTALSEEHLQADKSGEVSKRYESVGQAIPEGVWWWD